MVSKVEESRLRRQESTRSKEQGECSNGTKGKEQPTAYKKEVVRLQKVCKFKRSSFSEEDDATCSAILLLACVVCDPSSM